MPRAPASGMHPRDRDVPPRRRWLARALGAAALALALHAAWMPAKAALSQQLLRGTWEANARDGGARRPWPWADTHAVARLRFERLGIDQVVVAGDDGRALAFGPGWAAASAPPGTPGTTVISGHRDSHFAWLRGLRRDDEVLLDTARGPRRYRVTGTEVVDARTRHLALGDGDQLVLVTCWPFEATAPRGPLRYVVSLAPVRRYGGFVLVAAD